jgi:hypothetical protein
MKKITLLFTILCASALNGMDPTSLYELRRTGQKSATSDFQIYQLLSCATKNDPQFYLPNELVHAIATTTCEITKEKRRCYEVSCYSRYGICVCSVETLVHFIKKRAESAIDIQSTVDVLKICLRYSDRSLSTIQQPFNRKTALHEVVELGLTDYYIDVLCQAAGEDLIDFLCAQNQFGQTALHIATLNINKHVVEKFINIAQDRALELTSTGDNGNNTPLDYAQRSLKHLSKRVTLLSELSSLDQFNQMQSIAELLEAYHPKEQ